MVQLLPDRLPWFIAGPLIGLLVVALYALANRPLGVSGSYLAFVGLLRGRQDENRWRAWYFVGLIAGGLLVALLRGDFALSLDYGRLGQVVPLGALIPILFIAGILMGYGARWAGGCTSGHGICGTAVRSPGSFAATITFMATAVALTYLLHLVTGGLL